MSTFHASPDLTFGEDITIQCRDVKWKWNFISAGENPSHNVVYFDVVVQKNIFSGIKLILSYYGIVLSDYAPLQPYLT